MSALTYLTRARPGPAGWIWAVVLGAVAVGLRVPLAGFLGPIPFLPFLPVVGISALLFGWGQGLLTLAICAAAATWLLPSGWFAENGVSAAVAMGGFLGVAGAEILVVAALAALVRRLDRASRHQRAMFRELQHRVANNMQFIASMLERAGQRVEDPAARQVLEQATGRVIGMARLQRRLLDPDIGRHRLAPLLRAVLGQTFRGLEVTLTINVAPLELTADQRTALVLLVSEAATNAAKHVFSPRRGHCFTVALGQCPGGRARLELRDDGPGGVEIGRPDSGMKLGIAIMQGLAGQLGGPLVVGPGPGTVLQVEFPVS